MEFTIITLGDIKAFEAALNGVAMIFNPSNTTRFVSAGGVGFGGYITLALTIALLVALVRGVINLKFELGEMIITAILFAALFVPKFDVILEDYYSGEIAAVDNVPLGVAFPGAFISGLTADIADTLGQAFQVADPAAYGLKDGGFVAPLKILNSLKNGGEALKRQSPTITSSLQNVVVDCLYGRPNYDHEVAMDRADAFEYMMAQARLTQGITLYYDAANPTGASVTCEDAANRLTDRMSEFYSSNTKVGPTPRNPDGLSGFDLLLCSSQSSRNSTTGGCPTRQDYERAFASVATESGNMAVNFAYTTLLTASIREAAYCASAGADPTTGAVQCMPFVTALEQYKEDSAAAGSLFQRTMLNSMSLMLFLFYAFAPLISILMVIMGAKGIKLLGSYMLFGVWTQSWLPFATIIHFYIQVRFADDVQRFGGLERALLPSTYQDFYSQVSTSLGIASDLLAATPILTLALLSGSIFALTGVASRMSGRDYYDEKTNVPNPITNSGVALNVPPIAGIAGNRTVMANAANAPSINLSQTASSVEKTAIGLGNEAIRSYADANQKLLSEQIMAGNGVTAIQAYGKSRNVDITDAHAADIAKTYQERRTKDANTGRKVDDQNSDSRSETNQIIDSAAIQLGYGIGRGGGEGGGGRNGPSASAGAGRVGRNTKSSDRKESTSETRSTGTGVTTDETNSTAATDRKTFTTRDSVADEIKRQQQLSKSLMRNRTGSESDTTTRMLTEAESKRLSYERVSQLSQDLKTGTDLDFTSFQNRMAQSPEFYNEMRGIHARLSSNDKYQALINQEQNTLVGTTADRSLLANKPHTQDGFGNGSLAFATLMAASRIANEDDSFVRAMSHITNIPIPSFTPHSEEVKKDLDEPPVLTKLGPRGESDPQGVSGSPIQKVIDENPGAGKPMNESANLNLAEKPTTSAAQNRLMAAGIKTVADINDLNRGEVAAVAVDRKALEQNMQVVEDLNANLLGVEGKTAFLGKLLGAPGAENFDATKFRSGVTEYAGLQHEINSGFGTPEKVERYAQLETQLQGQAKTLLNAATSDRSAGYFALASPEERAEMRKAVQALVNFTGESAQIPGEPDITTKVAALLDIGRTMRVMPGQSLLKAQTQTESYQSGKETISPTNPRTGAPDPSSLSAERPAVPEKPNPKPMDDIGNTIIVEYRPGSQSN